MKIAVLIGDLHDDDVRLQSLPSAYLLLLLILLTCANGNGLN